MCCLFFLPAVSFSLSSVTFKRLNAVCFPWDKNLGVGCEQLALGPARAVGRPRAGCGWPAESCTDNTCDEMPPADLWKTPPRTPWGSPAVPAAPVGRCTGGFGAGSGACRVK